MERAGTEGVPIVVKNVHFNLGFDQSLKGRKEKFCTFINDYKINMFRLAKSILRNDDDAEDATGEAILKAYKNLDSLRSYASFKPWIMKILINEAYSLANQRKKVLYIEDMEISEEKACSDSGELWSAVSHLDEEFRTITVLFYYEDMSIKEISKTLGLPTGTVKSRLARARQKLKVLLIEEGGME